MNISHIISAGIVECADGKEVTIHYLPNIIEALACSYVSATSRDTKGEIKQVKEGFVIPFIDIRPKIVVTVLNMG